MYTVYIIKGNDNKLYKGVTNNLGRRIKEHKRGKTTTTSKMINLNVVYIEEYENFQEARKRELYLKTSAGRRFLEKILGL